MDTTTITEIPPEVWIQIKTLLAEIVAATMLAIISIGVFAIKYGINKIMENSNANTKEIVGEIYNRFLRVHDYETNLRREVNEVHNCVDETKKMILELGAMISGEIEKINLKIERYYNKQDIKDLQEKENLGLKRYQSANTKHSRDDYEI